MLLTPEILKINRAKKGLSQQAVADAIGVTLKSYQYYEAGDRNPKYDKVKKLVELLDIDLVTNVPRITKGRSIIKAPNGRLPKRIEQGKLIPFYDIDFTLRIINTKSPRRNGGRYKQA